MWPEVGTVPRNMLRSLLPGHNGFPDSKAGTSFMSPGRLPEEGTGHQKQTQWEQQQSAVLPAATSAPRVQTLSYRGGFISRSGCERRLEVILIHPQLPAGPHSLPLLASVSIRTNLGFRPSCSRATPLSHCLLLPPAPSAAHCLPNPTSQAP